MLALCLDEAKFREMKAQALGQALQVRRNILMIENQLEPRLAARYQALQDNLLQLAPLAIAFSGGVDSTLLLKAAIDLLGNKQVLAIIGDSTFMPRREADEAVRLADEMSANFLIIPQEPLQDQTIAANTRQRCYHCKKRLFSTFLQIAAEKGFHTLCDGTNTDDMLDWRPGQQAVQELGIRSPLQEAGLSKADIRQLSAHLGLATAQKPAYACLATRIPFDEKLTLEKLVQVEQAEDYLHSRGFSGFRVRHHGEIARLEIPPEQFARMLEEELRLDITNRLKTLGYNFITLDLSGYRSGSMTGKDGQK